MIKNQKSEQIKLNFGGWKRGSSSHFRFYLYYLNFRRQRRCRLLSATGGCCLCLQCDFSSHNKLCFSVLVIAPYQMFIMPNTLEKSGRMSQLRPYHSKISHCCLVSCDSAKAIMWFNSFCCRKVSLIKKSSVGGGYFFKSPTMYGVVSDHLNILKVHSKELIWNKCSQKMVYYQSTSGLPFIFLPLQTEIASSNLEATCQPAKHSWAHDPSAKIE